MSIMLTLGEKLADLRQGKKMTLKQVAKQTELSASTISNYENDKNKPTIESLRKLLEVYEVTEESFYGIELSDYQKDLNTFERYGFSEKFFKELLLFEKYGEQEISKCLNLLFGLNDSPLSAVSVFEGILQAFNPIYHEKLKSLSSEFSHDASMRLLLEPVVQSLTMVFEELYPEFKS